MNKIDFNNNDEPELSAEILMQMQQNMEKAGVYIGASAPTTGEKVWINTTDKDIYYKDGNTWVKFYDVVDTW